MSYSNDDQRFNFRLAAARATLQVFVNRVLDTWLAQNFPNTTLEIHPMKDHEFKVITHVPPAPNAGEVVLVLDGTTLNPAKYDDWAQAALYLHNTDMGDDDIDQAFELWVTWSQQTVGIPTVTKDAARAYWQNLGGSSASMAPSKAPMWGNCPGVSAEPQQLGQRIAEGIIANQDARAAELVDSPQNTIAALLERFTNERCGQIYIEDVAALQQALNDLIAPPVVAPEVLEAKGHTLKDLVSLGLITDEDMANHLADCAASLPGPAFTAKRIMSILTGLRDFQDLVYGLNDKAGWWSDLETGEPKVRNKGELMMLMVTEIAEGYEGVRKNQMDDKLQYRPMEEVEIGDMIIRGVDYTGGHKLDIGGAILHKLLFNQLREDHKREHRLGVNGKKT